MQFHEPIEESAVTLQCDAQILGRHIVAATPLPLELRAFIGKAAGQPFDDISHERVARSRRVSSVRRDRLRASPCSNACSNAGARTGMAWHETGTLRRPDKFSWHWSAASGRLCDRVPPSAPDGTP